MIKHLFGIETNTCKINWTNLSDFKMKIENICAVFVQ